MRPFCVFLLALSVGCEREAAPTDAAWPSSSLSGKPQSLALSQKPAASVPTPTPPEYPTPLPVRKRGDVTPAKRYANQSPAACSSELRHRKLPVRPARGKTPGLMTPLQLTAPLHGVKFELPRSIYGFLDCRLVLLLDDLAKDLSSRAVVGVQVNNVYRPNSKLPPKANTKLVKPPPKGKASKSRKPPPPRTVRLSQHALGLAIDITEFRLADGRVLNVERDWHGSLGAPPCGPGSRVSNDDPSGVLLRDLTCAIARRAYCNHLITPNRDEAHSNHLHCDIEAGADETMVE